MYVFNKLRLTFKQQFTCAGFSSTVDWPQLLVSVIQTLLVSAPHHCHGSQAPPTVWQAPHPMKITQPSTLGWPNNIVQVPL